MFIGPRALLNTRHVHCFSKKPWCWINAKVKLSVLRCGQVELFLSFRVRFECSRVINVSWQVLYRSLSKISIETLKMKLMIQWCCVHAVTCFDLAVSDWVPNFFVERFFAANRGPIKCGKHSRKLKFFPNDKFRQSTNCANSVRLSKLIVRSKLWWRGSISFYIDTQQFRRSVMITLLTACYAEAFQSPDF